MDISRESDKVYASNLDLFKIPSTNVGIIASEFHPVYPSNPLADKKTPVIFNIQGSNLHYLCLDGSILHCECQITKKDGSHITIADKIGINEDIGSSIFQSVECMVNSYSVIRSNPFYAYTAHFSNLLRFTEGRNNSESSAQLYMLDDKHDVFNSSNTGFTNRCKYTDSSSKFDFIRPLHISLANTNRPIPPETNIYLSFQRSPDDFVLVGGTTDTSGSSSNQSTKAAEPEYSLNILKCTLYLKKIILHPNLVRRHQALVASGKPYIYPVKHIDCKGFSFPAGITEYNTEILFPQNSPQLLGLCFITQASQFGSIKKNPFYFGSHGLASASVLLDGNNSTYRTVQLGDSDNTSVLGYYSLFQSLNHPHAGLGISRSMYPLKSIIIFDLLPNNIENTLTPLQKSQLRMELKFHKPVEENLVALVFCQLDALVEIDGKDKGVIVDQMMI